MTENAPVRIVCLNNGLVLNFYDRSNRYFGDFHRVFLVVEVRGDLDALTLEEEMRAALREMRDTVLYRRELERMGVPTERLEATVAELIDSFLSSTKSYLEKSEIPVQLVKKKMAEKSRHRRSVLRAKLENRS